MLRLWKQKEKSELYIEPHLIEIVSIQNVIKLAGIVFGWLHYKSYMLSYCELVSNVWLRALGIVTQA